MDYIGAVQGIPVCFDAKECHSATFPLANIHRHQINFMERFEKQGGVAFLILYFTKFETLYYLRYRELVDYLTRQDRGGRKSFRMDELDAGYVCPICGVGKDMFKEVDPS